MNNETKTLPVKPLNMDAVVENGFHILKLFGVTEARRDELCEQLKSECKGVTTTDIMQASLNICKNVNEVAYMFFLIGESAQEDNATVRVFNVNL
jgi:hypothetical protein